ncbi:MAG: hypothetical protein ABSB40_09005 [Nitrososphaeria archaeon]|jgi:hypothetical protein
MNKIETVIVLAILLSVISISFLPSVKVANASSGDILVGVPPQTHIISTSTVYITVGENLTLNFAQVTFAGSQFYLVWSRDGFSQISAGDFQFSPIFNVADLRNTTTILSSGIYIGDNWINIPTPENIHGGGYFVKCFDGSSASVAVSGGSQMPTNITSTSPTTTTTLTSTTSTTQSTTITLPTGSTYPMEPSLTTPV